MTNRFTQVTGVFLCLIKENKILLARRFQTGYGDGQYSLPAGHLDGNETITEALIRETLEEIGIIITPEDCKFIHALQLKTNRESINFFFEVKKWSGEPKICEPDKCDDLIWADLKNLPKNTLPYIKFVIEQYLKTNPYSEFGW